MVGRRATSAAASAGLVMVVRCAVASAQAPSPIHLVWTAPEECPHGAAVEAEITRLLGGPPRSEGGRALAVEATVTARGASYSLDLVTRDERGASGRRSLSATSCEALANAAALVVALGWDPAAVAAVEAAPTPTPAPLPAPEPPPPALVVPVPPPPGPVPAPAAAPVAPFAPSWPPPPRPRDPAHDAREPFVELGVALLVDAGGVPSVSPGIEGGGALLLGPFRLGAHVAVVPSSEAALEGDATVGGSFSQVFGVASFGRALAPWRGGGASHEVSAHVGFEAGATFASGFGVDVQRDAAVVWLAPRLMLEGRLGLPGGLGVHGGAGAAFPLVRRKFVLDNLGGVFSPSPVAARLDLGLDIRF